MERKILEPESSGLFTRVQALRSGLTDSDLRAAHYHRDQRRLAALRASGWHVMVVTSEELTRSPRELVQRVRAKLHERSSSFA
ncbi:MULTISPECIES: hypothetical protein [unclassified Actinopolyspora]|uniref:hypothetical protein n=1 Tax=Actinopolyspora TaxID=1849 RepID=UPI0013F61D68|nr:MULTISPECIES: hypothetical protein [unclassified Actinopolyspora]NHD16631.1 hypothetical protein [Actinopolyspora sp. BKK2]NHE75506.1 hypothetical protein [Actinopolyspora sp. BKK1]